VIVVFGNGVRRKPELPFAQICEEDENAASLQLLRGSSSVADTRDADRPAGLTRDGTRPTPPRNFWKRRHR
jgi:hypothetical protein